MRHHLKIGSSLSILQSLRRDEYPTASLSRSLSPPLSSPPSPYPFPSFVVSDSSRRFDHFLRTRLGIATGNPFWNVSQDGIRRLVRFVRLDHSSTS